jgi:hypothetical protein
MFEALIKRSLPATVKQLYAIAAKEQPHDWGGPTCPHHSKITSTALECMHQLRRELWLIAVHSGSRNGMWILK